MKTMGEYHDLYLKSDILLLADVFENFRKTCLQYYKIDPCHYFTSPGLSWDAMLKMTGIKLELMMSGYEAALTPYALIYMVRRRARSIRDLTKLRRVEGRGSGSVYFFIKECCFRVRVRVRASVNPNLTLTLK